MIYFLFIPMLLGCGCSTLEIMIGIYSTCSIKIESYTNTGKGERHIFQNYDDMLTVKELESALRISRSSAYKLLKENKLYFIKVGGLIRIPKKSLLEYLREACYNYNDVNGGLSCQKKEESENDR